MLNNTLFRTVIQPIVSIWGTAKKCLQELENEGYKMAFFNLNCKINT